MNQWHNTNDVIDWFKNIDDKSSSTFIQFDIEEFYPSISKNLLEQSLSHVSKYTTISENDRKIIMHSRRSLLFANGQHWVKKSNDPNFDVTMGSFDGAELCELVGLYVLYTIGEMYGFNVCGLYRDDGLCCFHKKSNSKS